MGIRAPLSPVHYGISAAVPKLCDISSNIDAYFGCGLCLIVLTGNIITSRNQNEIDIN